MKTGIAIADLHLGYRQFGLADRAEDFYRAFQYVVSEAVRLKVDFFLIAGDAINSVYPHPRCLEVLQAGVDALREKGILVLGISGNHDAVKPSWLELAGVTPLHNNVITVGGEVKISGLNFMPEAECAEAIKNIPDVDIFVMHQTFSEFVEYKNASALSVLKLNPKVPLYVFGDLHTGILRRFKDDKIDFQAGYPGSIELWKTDESRAKTMWKITVDSSMLEPSNRVCVEALPIRTRPVLDLTVVDEVSLTEAVSKIESCIKAMDLTKSQMGVYEGRPLVFLNYNSKVVEILGRLRMAVGEKCLLRPVPMDQATNEAVRYDTLQDAIQLKDVLSHWLTPSSPEFGMTMQFLENAGEREMVAQQFMDAVGVTREAKKA
jgi:DNA repair exonuclease SbcCD nuclease subunit